MLCASGQLYENLSRLFAKVLREKSGGNLTVVTRIFKESVKLEFFLDYQDKEQISVRVHRYKKDEIDGSKFRNVIVKRQFIGP